MKNTIRNMICIFVALCSVINFTVIGMKRASDSTLCQQVKRQKFDKILQSPYQHNSYKKSLKGTIELDDDVTIGFGNNACTAALNKSGIPTKHNSPLVAVKILVPNQKKTPQETQTFTDWTETVPNVIEKRILDIVKKQSQDEYKQFTQLGIQNEETWNEWYQRYECMYNSAQLKIKKFRYPVPLIPVHYLTASNVIHLNLFGCCNAQLTFDQHQKLDEQIKKFPQTPGMFSILDGTTESLVKEIETRQTLPQAETEHERNNRLEIINSLNSRLCEIVDEHVSITKKELLEHNLIKRDTTVRQNAGNCDIVGYNLLYNTNTAYKVGDSGPDMRPAILAHKLNKNPFDFIKTRETGLRI